MSEFKADEALLSREELDALLDTLAEGSAGAESALRARPFADAGRHAELLRTLEEFAAEQGRVLSTTHQTAISFTLLGWQELALRDFSGSLLATDRVAVLELSPGGERAWLLVSRPLVYGWMTRAFGAPDGAATVLPARPYTAIEERFLRRAAGELTRGLSAVWKRHHGIEAQLVGLQGPGRLREHGHRPHGVASFDVSGLGEVCRLRLALPSEVFSGRDAESERPQAPASTGLAGPVLDMPVEVRVEAGSSFVALSKLAKLAVGDVIPLDRQESGGLVVRVEERPKFRAVRGSVGTRLAVRVTERL